MYRIYDKENQYVSPDPNGIFPTVAAAEARAAELKYPRWMIIKKVS